MRITFSILCTLLFFNLKKKVSAQNTSFQRIEYASFDTKSSKSKQKDSLRIGLYYKIDLNGVVTILNDDDYHNTLTFNRYQLSAAQLEKLNSIFSSTKPLKKYVLKTNLDKDEFFQGSYEFFSVIYNNGTKDSLCFIVPFMSDKFQNVYHMLDSIYWADKKRLKNIHSFLIPQYFKNSLLSNYKKSKLPKKTPLPSFRLEDQPTLKK